MLVLSFREGESVTLTDTASGRVIRVIVDRVNPRHPEQINLAFHDSARHFEIQRERRRPTCESSSMTPPAGT